MKICIKKEILLEGLNNVSKALSNRNIIPILNGIKFEVTKKGIILTATDNDLSIKHIIDKKNVDKIEEEGVLIILGRYILDIVKKLPDGIIKIEDLDNTKAIISTTNSKFNLNCFPVEDFPKVVFEEEKKAIKLDTKIFKEIINQTSYATSTQASRPLLTGINIKIEKNVFECCATDSYRLAKRTFKLLNDNYQNINVVIPSNNVAELIKVLEDEEEVLECSIFNNKILFKYKNVLFQSSLLNGSYPNTDMLIPKEFDLKIEVDLDEFYKVIDRASIFAQVKEKNIIELEVNKNQIKITSNSPEIGKVEEKLKCDNLDDKNIKISFSAKYMLDALKTFKSKTVIISLNGEVKPIILTEKDNNNLIQLILPIKTF